MTTVKFSVIGNKMTSIVDGFGKEELQKILDKMNGDYKWYFELYSDSTLFQTEIGENVNGDEGLDIDLFMENSS